LAVIPASLSFLSSARADTPSKALLCKARLISGEERAALIKRIQFGGDEVVKAKDGAGSATLSMAWAAAKFTDALLRARGGETGVIIPTFVESDLFTDKVYPSTSSLHQGCEFFASKVELSKDGVGKIHGVGEIADWEKELLDACLKDLAGNIKKV
jgi:malate dehydrogenase